jgi:hypothetical protein
MRSSQRWGSYLISIERALSQLYAESLRTVLYAQAAIETPYLIVYLQDLWITCLNG